MFSHEGRNRASPNLGSVQLMGYIRLGSRMVTPSRSGYTEWYTWRASYSIPGPVTNSTCFTSFLQHDAVFCTKPDMTVVCSCQA